MAQHDYVIANGTGAAVRSDLNNALAAIVSQNSGATEPTTTYAYQFWADTTTNLLKIRNAANSDWITLRELDGTLTIEDGTVSAPGLAFADDLNTGIYSPGDNTFAVATDGVERVEFGTTEVVFNDGGANYDFRVEGDTNANLFFVDASADRVGIGTTSPDALLDVESATTPIIRVGDGTRHFQVWGGSTTQTAGIGTAYSSAFAFNINSSEVARIDSSGRLGIGTTSPTTILHLEESVSGDRTTIRLKNTSTGANSKSCIRFDTASDGTDRERANITSGDDGANTGYLAFQTRNTSLVDAVRIDSSQRMWLENAYASAASFVSTSKLKILASSSTNTGNVCIECYGNSTSARSQITFSNPNGAVGSISTSASATAYNTSSDYRLKENVVPLIGAVDRLNQLQVHRFNFIVDPDTTVDGFIAHEAQAVVPECVTGTKDEVDENGNPVYQGIDQSKLVPLLTAALQEALQKIETLEQRLNDAGIA